MCKICMGATFTALHNSYTSSKALHFNTVPPPPFPLDVSFCSQSSLRLLATQTESCSRLQDTVTPAVLHGLMQNTCSAGKITTLMKSVFPPWLEWSRTTVCTIPGVSLHESGKVVISATKDAQGILNALCSPAVLLAPTQHNNNSSHGNRWFKKGWEGLHKLHWS